MIVALSLAPADTPNQPGIRRRRFVEWLEAHVGAQSAIESADDRAGCLAL